MTDMIDQLKLYESGKSLREIGAMYGMSRSTIAYRIRKMGGELRGRSGMFKTDPEEMRRQRWLYERGYTVAGVAMIVNERAGTVAKNIVRAGGKIRHHGGARYLGSQMMYHRHLHEAGMSLRAIARAERMCQHTVRRNIIAAGGKIIGAKT